MRIGLITPEPGHPLLADTTALLAPEHTVEALDPVTLGDVPLPLAEVYLLKSRTPHALGLARHLERRGAAVVNSAAATALCQDRTEMAELALRAGLPFAATRTHDSLGAWAAGALLDAPVVVKSRRSRRGDLVARVNDTARLRELAREWPHEPVVVQDYAPNSGWDHKLWAIGDQVFSALRRSELSPGAVGPPAPCRSRNCRPAGPIWCARWARCSRSTSTAWTSSTPAAGHRSSWTSTPSPAYGARPAPRRPSRRWPCAGPRGVPEGCRAGPDGGMRGA